MESNKRLMQIIKEMRSDIKKLESENKALRVKLSQTGRKAEMLERTKSSPLHQDVNDEEAVTHASLRRNISAPELEQQTKDNTMTVRRYSISSLQTVTVGSKPSKSPNQKRTDQMNERAEPSFETAAQPCTIMKLSKDQEILTRLPVRSRDTHNQARTFQEYIHKCKFKVKSVTFLLPVDVAAESGKQGPSSKLPETRNSDQLATIQENDS
ncbi:putative coiled-coil domain-containing protein 195 [Callorhinchus milii]|uniref:putative coiled-coil domain-containing protein 195 n=1 Tax=Callorhinchus milii TaxID=7868 RepID=UPI00045756A1|nr:putative coiled-coil domain-containing protein 195 [Callorhinchus milii]|eukprot:gi/632935145/ref/XP_007887996.1/ PREDICTED: uncharacterized protein LOC103176347 [Callorhinchus milii]